MKRLGFHDPARQGHRHAERQALPAASARMSPPKMSDERSLLLRRIRRRGRGAGRLFRLFLLESHPPGVLPEQDRRVFPDRHGGGAAVHLYPALPPRSEGSHYSSTTTRWGLPLNNIPPGKEFWFGTNIYRPGSSGRVSGRAPAPPCSSASLWLWSRPWWASSWACCGAMSASWTSSSPSCITFWTTFPRRMLLILISYVMKPGVSTIMFAMCLTGLAGHGAVHPQPDHHHPRPGLQPGLPLPGHVHRAHHRQEPAALYGVRHHHAHGAGHSLGHRQRGVRHLHRHRPAAWTRRLWAT